MKKIQSEADIEDMEKGASSDLDSSRSSENLIQLHKNNDTVQTNERRP